jgi:hypothetical protein
MGVLLDSIKLVSLNRTERLVDFKRLIDQSYVKLELQGFPQDNKENLINLYEPNSQTQ